MNEPVPAIPAVPTDSPEAERTFIACCLLDGDATISRALACGAKAEWFTEARNRVMFQGIVELHQQGVVVDSSALAEHLRKSGRLSEVGGYAGLTEASGTVATTVQADFFIDTVRWYFEARENMRAALAVVESLKAGDHDRFDKARRRFIDLAEMGGTAGQLPEPMDLGRMLEEDWPEAEAVIPGLLDRGSKMVLGGGSKTFKTWTLSDLALSVATGSPWWGFETRKGKVLYINLELEKRRYRDRLEKIKDAKRVTHGTENLVVWNLRGYAADLERLMPDILSRTVGNDYSVILIDPIYKVYGRRKEVAAEEMAELLNLLERIAVKTNAAIVFGAHFSKGNQAAKDAMDRISGSGVFGRDPDTIMTLTRHEEDGAFTVDVTLRNHEPLVPFVVRWQAPLMVRDSALNPAHLKQAAGAPVKYNESTILQVLGNEELTSGEWEQRSNDQTGIKRSRFMDIRKALVARGVVANVSGRYRVVDPARN